MALTIPELFQSTVERAPWKSWLTFENSSYTFGEASARIAGMASALDGVGIKHGVRVLATPRNSPEYLFLWLALMHLGAVLLPVNPKSTQAELVGLAAQLSPHFVVTDDDLRSLVEASIAESAPKARLVMIQDIGGIDSVESPLITVRPDDPAVLISTSGTTGRSKLVVQTHRAYAMAGEGFPFWLGLNQNDRMMTSLPLFHINAPAYSIMGSVAAGAGLILLPRFSGSQFIDWSRRYGATQFNAIGAMLEILMRQPPRHDDAENPLRLCYTGPSPPKQRHLEIERRFGFRIVCGYGLSESPYGLIWKKETRPFETLGVPRQHPTLGVVNQARVRNEVGQRVRVGEIGELELNNPAIMIGYYGMPDETREALSDNGWLKTGDLVRRNRDGTYTFVGRKKEIIRRRGENLSPTEVEVVLESHPSVAEAAVVGVPSELTEEEVKAFIVLVQGAEADLVEVRAFVAERLAPFKVPRFFEILDELPHTPTARIAKHKLPRHRTDEEVDLNPSTDRGVR